jgi:predicted patatin/cPLA2 family phospholipase
MKRMHQANDALDERYTNSLEYFETTNKLIFQWYVEIQSVLANHKSGYKQIRKRSKKANKHVKIEYAIYKPNSVIRNHISGLESANKHLQRSAKRLKRRNERIIGKIERLERG